MARKKITTVRTAARKAAAKKTGNQTFAHSETQQLAIIKDLPIPSLGKDGTGMSIYPFEKMLVGDAFVAPKEKLGACRQYVKE